MSSRHRSRERAIQLLYQWESSGESPESVIQEFASNWKIERMAPIDRNILRMAIFEMDQAEAVPAVIIDEAIELGRRFSGEKSSKFINGVLDAIRRARYS